MSDTFRGPHLLTSGPAYPRRSSDAQIVSDHQLCLSNAQIFLYYLVVIWVCLAWLGPLLGLLCDHLLPLVSGTVF